jgi:hypothetical protein
LFVAELLIISLAAQPQKSNLGGQCTFFYANFVHSHSLRKVLSVFSKGFERLINGQVLAHVDLSGFLSEFQSGIRCGYSTMTALVRFIED